MLWVSGEGWLAIVANPLSAQFRRAPVTDALKAQVLDGPTLAQPPLLEPAVVDYVIQLHKVDNPRGLKELQYKKRMDVWKVLVRNDEIIEALAVTSSHVIDERYLFKN
jgi:hypothetical protein